MIALANRENPEKNEVNLGTTFWRLHTASAFLGFNSMKRLEVLQMLLLPFRQVSLKVFW